MQCDSDAIFGEKVLVIGALLSLASIKTVTPSVTQGQNPAHRLTNKQLSTVKLK
jgi:hypothetical protein